MRLLAALCSGILAHTIGGVGIVGDEPLWMSRFASPESRAAALLASMNMSDKIALLHMSNCKNYTGQTDPVPHLGIPALLMNNGRQGFGANDVKQTGQTAFPCQLAVASTFDTSLYHAFGEALGQEFFAKGANVALAPMLILARVPHGGRNVESIGEDGEVGYQFARAQITGLQSVGGVIANADDFVLNNQETGRMGVDSVCDERTQRELYYRAYEGAIAGEVVRFQLVYCARLPMESFRTPLRTAPAYTHAHTLLRSHLSCFFKGNFYVFL
jgi:beta-glucosidase